MEAMGLDAEQVDEMLSKQDEHRRKQATENRLHKMRQLRLLQRAVTRAVFTTNATSFEEVRVLILFLCVIWRS